MFQANSELGITEFVAASCWTSRRLKPLALSVVQTAGNAKIFAFDKNEQEWPKWLQVTKKLLLQIKEHAESLCSLDQEPHYKA